MKGGKMKMSEGYIANQNREMKDTTGKVIDSTGTNGDVLINKGNKMVNK
jgi:hypothetical protein